MDILAEYGYFGLFLIAFLAMGTGLGQGNMTEFYAEAILIFLGYICMVTVVTKAINKTYNAGVLVGYALGCPIIVWVILEALYTIQGH